MSGDHDDFQSEPIRGLPERPPAGEHILWQGSPSWGQLAKEVFHIRLVTAYFLGLMAWRAHGRMAGSGDLHAAVISIAALLPVALFGIGLLALLARLYSRTTIYTITSRRVVIRTGIAITLAVNLPFRQIGAASLRQTGGGHGDIVLTTLGDERIAYATLWPSVRPLRLTRPEPMLRGIAGAEMVAATLAKAVREALPGATLAADPVTTRPGRQTAGLGLPAAARLSS